MPNNMDSFARKEALLTQSMKAHQRSSSPKKKAPANPVAKPVSINDFEQNFLNHIQQREHNPQPFIKKTYQQRLLGSIQSKKAPSPRPAMNSDLVSLFTPYQVATP